MKRATAWERLVRYQKDPVVRARMRQYDHVERCLALSMWKAGFGSQYHVQQQYTVRFPPLPKKRKR